MGPEFLDALRAFEPEVGVVVAYGHLLKPDVLAVAPRGMVNVHASLLPALRGAAPIEWAILTGETRTGVSIMLLDAGLDSGPILHQLPHHIDPDVTGGELTEHLAEMGAQALIEALALWEQGELRPVPQDATKATYAPKLTRETSRIPWQRDADVVARTIRALDPRPGAWTTLAGREVKLYGARVSDGVRGTPGEILVTDGRLVVATGRGAVEIEEVQPAGRGRMRATDWLHGRGAEAGQTLV